jgi:hypothetical protein
MNTTYRSILGIAVLLAAVAASAPASAAAVGTAAHNSAAGGRKPLAAAPSGGINAPSSSGAPAEWLKQAGSSGAR